MLVYFALFAQVFATGAATSSVDEDSQTFMNAVHHSHGLSDDVKAKMLEHRVKSAGQTRNLRDQLKLDDLRIDFFLDDQCTMPSESKQNHAQYCHFDHGMRYKMACNMMQDEVHITYADYGDQPDCSAMPSYQPMDYPLMDDMGHVVRAGQCVHYDNQWAMIHCERKDHLQFEDGVHYVNFQMGDEGCKPKSEKTHSHGFEHGIIRFGQCFKDGAHKSILGLDCDEHGANYYRFPDSDRCEGEHSKMRRFNFPRPCDSQDNRDHESPVEKWICKKGDGMPPAGP